MKPANSLDLIQIASPCRVAWDDMTGDERTRFCRSCQQHVYNVSEMSREEAEALIAGRAGRTCLRLFRREDGTMLTRDCPVGVRYLRQRFARSVAAIAGVLVALLGGTLFGGALGRLAQGTIKAPANAFAEWIDPPPRIQTLGQMIMGDICILPNPPPAPPPPSPQDPAETPLPEPTAEQLQAIQQRLQQ